MFDYFKQIFIMILLNSFINANEYYIYRHKRAIGGESLDTSNFVLYIDPNGTRFIEVPREFMNNWLGDQKMWRRWSIILAIMSCIFFGTLLFFLIHGFCTSTGPFADCTKHNNENSSDDRLTSSEMSVNEKDRLGRLQQISVLQSSAQFQLK